MKIYKKVVSIFIGIVTLSTLSMASQASKGVKIFKQADGSTFYGVLHGDSAFNWIESDGKIVKYNHLDKSYHIVTLDDKGDLVMTPNKPSSITKKSSSLFKTAKNTSLHTINKEQRLQINKISKSFHKNNFPR